MLNQLHWLLHWTWMTFSNQHFRDFMCSKYPPVLDHTCMLPPTLMTLQLSQNPPTHWNYSWHVNTLHRAKLNIALMTVQKLAVAAVWTWRKLTREFHSRYLLCKKTARPCYLIFERCQYWLWHTAQLSPLPKTKLFWLYCLVDWNFISLKIVPAPVNWQRKKALVNARFSFKVKWRTVVRVAINRTSSIYTHKLPPSCVNINTLHHQRE